MTGEEAAFNGANMCKGELFVMAAAASDARAATWSNSSAAMQLAVQASMRRCTWDNTRAYTRDADGVAGDCAWNAAEDAVIDVEAALAVEEIGI